MRIFLQIARVIIAIWFLLNIFGTLAFGSDLVNCARGVGDTTGCAGVSGFEYVGIFFTIIFVLGSGLALYFITKELRTSAARGIKGF
jgi:hypothetical protein